jgi:hypothetical protein
MCTLQGGEVDESHGMEHAVQAEAEAEANFTSPCMSDS